MELVERIRQAQQSQAEQAAREKAAAEATIEKERLIKEESEKRARGDYERRLQLKRQQTEEILRESGVSESLSQIEKTFLQGKFKNHTVIYDYGSYSDMCRIELTWSNDDLDVEKNVGGAVHVWGHNRWYIVVDVDLSTEDLTIESQTKTKLTKPQWMNREVVEITIADSFVNAGYCKPVYNTHEPYDGGNC
jgi:hypothetical protein